MSHFCLLLAVLAAVTVSRVRAQVAELDDSFEEIKGDDPWLVQFYAPWCGHCRRLAPTYHQVYLALMKTNIKVAKVDGTRYSHIAAEYEVRGFPTIKFIQGDKQFTFRGDRSRDGIIEFAKRAMGPQVRYLTTVQKLHEARSEHSHQVLFLYVGTLDVHNDFFSKYISLAEKYAVMSYFYALERHVLPKNYVTHFEPSILVFKDDTYYEFEQPKDGTSKKSMDDWINGELYEAFPKMTSGSLNEMGELKKKLAMFLIDEDDRVNEAKHERIKEMGRQLATKYRHKYHQFFQFLWMGENESANQITMSWIDPPQIMVLDAATQYYYWPPFNMQHASIQAIAEFLDTIINSTAPVYGGTAFHKRLQRVGWDVFSTIYTLWHEAGWLALVIFGIPAIVISIVCYALCCMEPFDENMEEEGQEEDEDDEPQPEDISPSLPVSDVRKRKRGTLSLADNLDSEQEALLPEDGGGMEVEVDDPSELHDEQSGDCKDDHAKTE